MAYFMLDLLYLMGDPKQSLTLLDNTTEDGPFNVNETIPKLPRVNKRVYNINTYTIGEGMGAPPPPSQI